MGGDLGGNEEKEVMTRMYCMNKKNYFQFKKSRRFSLVSFLLNEVIQK